jgi:tetratricopeptide (TPR) repeat protein
MKKHDKRKVHQTRQPTIAVCVITKNEEEFIGSCLDSVRPFVDELVVVDTGSTDRTVEIAREHGARVEFFAWCDDFAAARNAAINATTSDWILMLDADEELDSSSAPALRELIRQRLPQDMIGYSIMIENRLRNGSEDSIRHAVTRLFPRLSDLRYVGTIHEDLFRVSDPKRSQVQFVPQIRVFHYGYDPVVYVARAKDERNLRMLELALEREPENPRILYHLGQQHLVAQRYPQAVAAFERFEPRAGSLPRHYQVDLYRMWIQALVALADEDALDRVARRAEEHEALSAQSRQLLANYELSAGRLGLALRHLMGALNPDAPIGVAAEPGVGGWRTRLVLADVYEKLEEPASALDELDRALPDVPSIQKYAVATRAVRLALDGGRVDAARLYLGIASEHANDVFDVQTELFGLRLGVLRCLTELPEDSPMDRLDSAVAFGDWQAAYEAAMVLPLGDNASLVREVHVSNELRQRRAPDAALDLLGRALDAYPPSAALYWPLIQTLSDLQRFDDAIAATEILKSVS